MDASDVPPQDDVIDLTSDDGEEEPEPQTPDRGVAVKVESTPVSSAQRMGMGPPPHVVVTEHGPPPAILTDDVVVTEQHEEEEYKWYRRYRGECAPSKKRALAYLDEHVGEELIPQDWKQVCDFAHRLATRRQRKFSDVSPDEEARLRKANPGI